MQFLKFLFITISLLIPSICYGADFVTPHYELVVPTARRGWLETISRDFISIDSILYLISQDVGTTGPTTQLSLDIISSDVGLISETVVILSTDTTDWDILTYDVGLISNTVVILSNDSVSYLTSPVADGDVDNDITLTDITQITSRSHTDLSDIGTNTHAQIDLVLSNRVSDDAVLLRLSSDTISCDALSADLIYYEGFPFPQGGPTDNYIFKYDATKKQWAYEADASGTGKLAQIVNIISGDYGAWTDLIPCDTSKPQNIEGGQVLELAITPASATNNLKIDAVIVVGNSEAAYLTAALFQDAGVDALATVSTFLTTNDKMNTIPLTYKMAAGTTSETTFKIRAGASAGTIYINGESGAARFNGTCATSMTITEYE